MGSFVSSGRRTAHIARAGKEEASGRRYCHSNGMTPHPSNFQRLPACEIANSENFAVLCTWSSNYAVGRLGTRQTRVALGFQCTGPPPCPSRTWNSLSSPAPAAMRHQHRNQLSSGGSTLRSTWTSRRPIGKTSRKQQKKDRFRKLNVNSLDEDE